MSVDGELSLDLIESFDKDFNDSKTNELVQRAVIQNGIDSVAVDQNLLRSIERNTYSHDNFHNVITSQKASGRCWIFAALNFFRTFAIKKMQIKNDFEFSQNYVAFWDKFERCNWFFENIIATANKKLDSRLVFFLLDKPIEDGGQLDMFMNIVKKYGLIPKHMMPESNDSSASRRMNGIINNKLREGAQILREHILKKNESKEEIQKLKNKLLTVIYRILCIHLGTPPKKFDWQWKDTKKNFHRANPNDKNSFIVEKDEKKVCSSSSASSSDSPTQSKNHLIDKIYSITPLQFANAYIPQGKYITLVHDPRNPFNKTLTVEMLGNVKRDGDVVYLNVSIETMKKYAITALKRGDAVFFGCDVGKQISRSSGVWHKSLLRYDQVYQSKNIQDKKDRINYHVSLMTHAMLFVGVDLDDKSNARKWKVENSWGDQRGNKGYYCMDDGWFDEYVYEIGVKKSDLDSDHQKALEDSPIKLPYYDPMGSLACSKCNE